MWRNYLFIALGIVPITYVLFFYRFSFNFEIEENGHYLLLLLLSLVQVVRILFLAGRHASLRQNITDAILSLTLLSVYILIGAGNEYAGVCLSLAISLGLFIRASTRQLTCLLYSFLPFLFVELVLAFLQCCRSQPVLGSLQNTGIFSIYLSTHIPLAFHAAFKNNMVKKRPKNIIAGTLFALFFLFSFYIMIKGQSRTALISSILVVLLLAYENPGSWFGKKITRFPAWSRYAAIPGTLVLLGALTAYLYSLKKLSAQGRLFMSNVTVRHITDHFWFGTGIGRFTWYYPQWQAAYFQDTPAPPHDFLLSAGESYVICNEYLQLFGTIGALGFAAFLILLFAFFRKGSQQYAHPSPYQGASHYKDLLRTVRLTVVAVLAGGFTSYPFHINIILFLFILCLVIGFKINRETARPQLPFLSGIAGKKAGPILRTVSLCVSISFLLLVLYKNIAVWKWQQGRARENLSYAEEKTTYAQLYPILKNDGKFLSDYGSLLTEDTTDCPMAVRILEKSRQYFISKQATEVLGYAYWKTNDLQNAIKIFEWETCYLPNLFRPKLMLMKLYKKTGDIHKMNSIGKIIIDTTPKVPSEEVNSIKQEAKLLLGQAALSSP